MKIGGNPLLSRQTIVSGRTLFLLSVSVILAVKLGIDTSSLKLFEVAIRPTQLNNGALVGVALLAGSLLVHWVGDLLSLGLFNSASRKKAAGKLFDELGDDTTKLESIIRQLNDVVDTGGPKEQSEGQLANAINNVQSELAEIVASAKWYRGYAFFYVVIWGFAVPSLAAVYAMYLLRHG